MRKIVLTAAALVGFATPALADLTLPVGDYPQVGGSVLAEQPAPAQTFSATVEPSTHFFMGHQAHAHHGRVQR